MAGPTTARGAAGRRPSPPGPAVRRRLPRLPRRRAVRLLLVALVLAAAATWVCYGSSWLRTERVTVSGTRVLTPRQVRAVAAVPLGSPMAAVDTGAIAHRLRTRLPRVADVEVSRAWPHTVRLTVRERRPGAVMAAPPASGKAGSAKEYREVDVHGVRFGTVTTRPKGVPLLQVRPDGTASSRRFGPDRLREAGVRCAVALPAAVRTETRYVRVRSYDSITIELTDGRTVMWGSDERGAAKAKTLTALMKAEPEAQHFDVSAPSAPAVSGS